MKTQHEIFPSYRFPKTNLQEVLLTLIIKGNVSIIDYPYLSGFRTRISELVNKHDLTLTVKILKWRNKFNNPCKCSVHHLPLHEKDRAIELYKKLNK